MIVRRVSEQRIGVVVLAAGQSTRFSSGPSKLLATIDGIPLVRLAVTTAVEADVGDVAVVTGHRAREVAAALEGLRMRVVHEPAFADGMAVSLRRGVRTLFSHDAIMVGLGDQPGLRAESYRRVAAAWRSTGASIVVPRYVGSKAPAHPPLFAAAVFDELLALEGDVGARAVIGLDPTRVVEVALDWAPPPDVDTLEDLESLGATGLRQPLSAPRDDDR